MNATKPVMPWPGGKTSLLKYLLPAVPEHKSYVEIFGGGMALLLAKEPSTVEVVNDINGELIQFYRNVKFHLDELLREMEWMVASRAEFLDYITQPGLTEIQKVARWYYRNVNGFAGDNRSFGRSKKTGGAAMGSRQRRLEKLRALNTRLDHVCIEKLPWDKCIELYDHEGAFFFCDPPYMKPGGANYYNSFSPEEMTRLRDRLVKAKGRSIVTTCACDICHNIFSAFPKRTVSRALGINNAGKQKNRKITELIITLK